MAEAAVDTFVQFFKQYIHLCASCDWPNNDTKSEEITKALQTARHVEQSINKMKSKSNCYEGFSKLVFVNENYSHTFLENCFKDPPKCILKKIITSDANLIYIDYAFEAFKSLYSKERLIEVMSELIVETASKETLVKNMSTVLSEHQLQELKRHFHLMAILGCESGETLKDTLVDCSQELMDTLVLCLVSDNVGDLKKEDTKLVRRNIITGFIELMNDSNNLAENFWERLLSVNKDNLIEMCLEYASLRELMFEAIINNYILVKSNKKDSFDLCFLKHQIESKFKAVFINEILKLQFIRFLRDYKNADEDHIKAFFNS